MENFKESFRKQETKWKEMTEEIKREFKTQRKKWEREREKMRRNMVELKNRMETLEQKESQEAGGKTEVGRRRRKEHDE